MKVKITRSTYKDDTYYEKVRRAVSELLKEERVVKPVDVFIKMGNLTKEQYEDWRCGRVVSLECVIAGSLSKIRRILNILRFHAEEQGLTPSKTVYTKWGKGQKPLLQFSKTGHSWLEELYSTHYVRTDTPRIMAKKKIQIPIREGKPSACIRCGHALHQKSEYYCSQACYQAYSHSEKTESPPFLSKWKIRKRKTARDPSISLRNKTRAKTKDLIKQGKLKKKPCVVCHNHEVVPHHEDYSNPFQVIWLCEQHHNAYHDGHITLFHGKLRWNPDKLIPKGQQHIVPKKKYQKLQKDYQKLKDKSR